MINITKVILMACLMLSNIGSQALYSAPLQEQQTVYFVTVSGVDSENRDGLTAATAWKSLAYACERVPAGDNQIKLGAGTFIETHTSYPKNGISIVGSGMSGSDATQVVASADWVITGTPSEFNYTNYIIAATPFEITPGSFELGRDITIRDIDLRSSPNHLLDGAIYMRDVYDLALFNLHIEDFRWTAMRLAFDTGVEVRDCELINVNTTGDPFFPGDIYTAFIEDAVFHDITFINNLNPDPSIRGIEGAGYKGGGHENVKIYNCSFMEDGQGFDIEIPFEKEYGVEIYNCKFDAAISIPFSRETRLPEDDPNTRGFPYSFWIHDNYITTPYAIEGPRNHLLLTDNFFNVKGIDGRIYTQFGGSTDGPIWIYNNVARNVDRSFIWKTDGRLDSVKVYNNTVYFADAEERAAAMLDVYDNAKGWEVKNNIFVAAESQPRALGGGVGCPSCTDIEVDFENNLVLNTTDEVPAGNFTGQDPGLFLSGEKPFPYYRPASASSFVVDKGVNVGLPFEGSAPDIGAYEYMGDSCTATGNLALGQSVSASGAQNGNPASRVVDGTDNTDANRWSVRGFGNWVEVDLGSVQSVDKIEIVPYRNRGYQYKIETKSTANSSYSTAVDEMGNTAGNTALLRANFAARDARYVRFTFTGCSGSNCSVYNWTSLREVRVYGCSNDLANASVATANFTSRQASEGLSETEEIIVYPNPGEGIFYIRLGATSKTKLRVMDLSGRVVREFNPEERMIDLSDKPNGVYVLRTAQGKTIKLIKE